MIRNTIIPLAWTALLAVIFGVALYFSMPAKADPYDPAADYANEYGPVICEVLDQYPNVDGLLGTILGVRDNSTPSNYQAGRAVGIAIYQQCPRHADLIDEAMASQPKGQVV